MAFLFKALTFHEGGGRAGCQLRELARKVKAQNREAKTLVISPHIREALEKLGLQMADISESIVGPIETVLQNGTTLGGCIQGTGVMGYSFIRGNLKLLGGIIYHSGLLLAMGVKLSLKSVFITFPIEAIRSSARVGCGATCPSDIADIRSEGESQDDAGLAALKDKLAFDCQEYLGGLPVELVQRIYLAGLNFYFTSFQEFQYCVLLFLDRLIDSCSWNSYETQAILTAKIFGWFLLTLFFRDFIPVFLKLVGILGGLFLFFHRTRIYRVASNYISADFSKLSTKHIFRDWNFIHLDKYHPIQHNAFPTRAILHRLFC